MREQQVSLSLKEEHRFWLRMLQDHAVFVRDALSVEEHQWVAQARWYIAAYDSLIQKLEGLPDDLLVNSREAIQFAQEAWPIVLGYYQLEGQLQLLRIYNRVTLSLSPTYFNGTLSENQEYLRQLNFLKQGMQPMPLSLVDLLELWLEDQVGHASLLRNLVDPIELGVIREMEKYIQTFQAFIVQNHHIRRYLQFAPPGMPRQLQLAAEVGQTVVAMNQYIQGVVERYKNNSLLNKTTLRFLEHHFPETCYLLKKLTAFVPSLAAVSANCTLYGRE